jgi:hypothetical protein
MRIAGTLGGDGRVELSAEPPERPDAAASETQFGAFGGKLARVPATRDDAVELHGTWTTADRRELSVVLAERRPAAVGPYRLRSRTLEGESDERRFRDLVSPSDMLGHPVPGFHLELTCPDLVGPDGRPAMWFRRHVESVLFGLLFGFVDDCNRTQQTTLDDEGTWLVLDYEVAYASPRVVSILFRQRGHCDGVPDKVFEDESGLNVDLRTRRIVRFDRQFISPRFGRRMMSDFDSAVSEGTVFDNRLGIPDNPGGDYGGWYFDENGVSLMHFSALRTTGAIAYLVVPWAFVRQGLRRSSPLYGVAFPPKGRLSAP